MDAGDIRRCESRLSAFLSIFGKCFAQCRTRQHLATYVRGLMSDLERKSVEPIALAAGLPPRTLQQFVRSSRWDAREVEAVIHRRVARRHGRDRTIGLIDETSCAKKGSKTPGVQRQYCGSLGKVENCVVTVHLGYSVDEFQCLLSSELYLPRSWSEDRDRCGAADIPDDMEYRPKWVVALELYDRARAHGVSFRYLVFDEGYGGKPEFLRQLAARGQVFVAEVPRSFMGWIERPHVATRSYGGRRGARLGGCGPRARDVETLVYRSRKFQEQQWEPMMVKDTTKGPLAREVKHSLFSMKDERGLPGEVCHLIAVRDPRNIADVKWFVSNAAVDTPLGELVHVAFARWRIERCFEDQKTELGFDHFEGRSYRGLRRHQALVALSHLFLSEMREKLGEKKSGDHGVPGAHRDEVDGVLLVAASNAPSMDSEEGRRGHPIHAEAQRRGEALPHRRHHHAIQGKRPQSSKPAPRRLGHKLAL